MHDLPTDPYKGVRDFFPEDMRMQEFIFDTWSKVSESFGYERYDASVLEPADLYRAKSGEEIVNDQTYTFTDRGEREVTLRPEMTPSVARMVAAKRQELAFPLRWYSMPNLFRYERPQKGRLREHWQLNCDLFGSTAPEADIEIIQLADSIMKAFGAESSMYEIQINNLSVFPPVLMDIGLPEEKLNDVRRLLDQRHKIDDYDQKIEELTGTSAASLDEKLAAALDRVGISQVISKLNDLGIKNVSVNTSLVRGQDYYTGTVFEVFDTSGENRRSMFGGGRYDNLIGLFGGEAVCGVGFGMGDVTIRDFLTTHNLVPELSSPLSVMVLTTGEELMGHAQKAAAILRNGNISTATNLTSKKLGDQIKLAEKRGAEYVIVVGDNEAETGIYTLQNLASGEKQEGTLEQIIEILS